LTVELEVSHGDTDSVTVIEWVRLGEGDVLAVTH